VPDVVPPPEVVPPVPPPVVPPDAPLQAASATARIGRPMAHDGFFKSEAPISVLIEGPPVRGMGTRGKPCVQMTQL
jgi:hypothetical protein